jgi:hypothetical protein
MDRRPVPFIDDGGVMNDNAVRSEQWAVLLGEYFSVRVGGEPGPWAEANRTVFQGAFDSLLDRLPSFRTNNEFEQAYADTWVQAMFDGAGFAPPPPGAARLAHYRDSPAAATAFRHVSVHSPSFTSYTWVATPSTMPGSWLATMMVPL